LQKNTLTLTWMSVVLRIYSLKMHYLLNKINLQPNVKFLVETLAKFCILGVSPTLSSTSVKINDSHCCSIM